MTQKNGGSKAALISDDEYCKLDSALNWNRWLDKMSLVLSSGTFEYATGEQSYGISASGGANFGETDALAYFKRTVSQEVNDFIDSLGATDAHEVFKALEAKYGHLNSTQELALYSEVFSMGGKINTITQFDRLKEIIAILDHNMSKTVSPITLFVGALEPKIKDEVCRRMSNAGREKNLDPWHIEHIILDVLEANGENSSATTSKPTSKPTSKKCYNCNETGHLERDCELHQKERTSRDDPRHPANALYISSMYTHHIVNRKEWFEEFSSIEGNVYNNLFANNLPVMGKGLARVPGQGLVLKDAYYVPSAVVSLISLQVLAEGKSILFDQEGVRNQNTGEIYARYNEKARLYKYEAAGPREL